MASNNGTIKLIITEDQGLILHSLVSMLQNVEEFTIAGTARNGVELLDLLKESKPDIILMDIKMPMMNGLDSTRVIMERTPWVKIIALSMYDSPLFIREILKAGARGFMSKNCTFEELCEGINAVHSGKTFLCKTATEIVMNNFAGNGVDNFDELHSLTVRETEVVRLLSQGLPTREIADKLFISGKTVERHKANVMKKMKVKNTAQLIRLAFEKGILLS
jgi:two-component system nitrate/nitrite response regulator NarL